MNRRGFLGILAVSALAPWAQASALDGVSGAEAAQAVREGLGGGAKAALAKLGQRDGYFANPRVRIGLPRNFAKAERFLRALGHGRKVDDLVLAMNRTAEMALPRVEKRILEAARDLAVTDAKPLIAGGDQAMTTYFRQATEARLVTELKPAIASVLGPSGLARSYGALSATLVQIAGLKSEQATVEDYINKKALEGLYAMMGMEETAFRNNPTRYAGGVAGKIFSLIQ